MEEKTLFQEIYDCFLSMITDDMYIEMTPLDTKRDCQQLLLNHLTQFEFPRFKLYDYSVFEVEEVWDEEKGISDYIDSSYYNMKLTREEIRILGLIMMIAWLDRQISSIEYTRMKYFKMSSQANHLNKLLGLKEASQKDLTHAQRLYKRRKNTEDGYVAPNWSSIMEKSTFNG